MKTLFQHNSITSRVNQNIGLFLVLFCLFSHMVKAQTPSAQPDYLSATANTPQLFNPLTNDTGNNLTLLHYTQPRYGSLSLNETTGELTYTPNPNYYGRDNFVYQIADSEAQTAEAPVFIDIAHNGVMPLSVFSNYDCSLYDYTIFLYIAGGLPPYTVTSAIYNGTVPDESLVTTSLLNTQRYNITITDAAGATINVNNLSQIQPCLTTGVTDVD